MAQHAVLEVFLTFCRVGACLMMAPGFASDRVPMRIRLGIALVCAFVISPVAGRGDAPIAPYHMALTIGLELGVGGLIGLQARLFIAALETLLTAAAMSIGLGNAMTASVEAAEHVSPLAAIGSLAASVCVFVSDAHLELLRGLAASYDIIPRGGVLPTGGALSQLVDACARTFFLALRLASPFLVYGVVANLAAGLINRFAAQAPFYFISAPLILLGGLALAALTMKNGLVVYIAELAAWAARG